MLSGKLLGNSNFKYPCPASYWGNLFRRSCCCDSYWEIHIRGLAAGKFQLWKVLKVSVYLFFESLQFWQLARQLPEEIASLTLVCCLFRAGSTRVAVILNPPAGPLRRFDLMDWLLVRCWYEYCGAMNGKNDLNACWLIAHDARIPFPLQAMLRSESLARWIQRSVCSCPLQQGVRTVLVPRFCRVRQRFSVMMSLASQSHTIPEAVRPRSVASASFSSEAPTVPPPAFWLPPHCSARLHPVASRQTNQVISPNSMLA